MKIIEAGDSYTNQMGMYPVFELTLKSAKQEDCDMASYMIQNAVGMEFERHRHIVEGGKEYLFAKEYEQYIDAYPHPYWINTSSNDIIKALVAR